MWMCVYTCILYTVWSFQWRPHTQCTERDNHRTRSRETESSDWVGVGNRERKSWLATQTCPWFLVISCTLLRVPNPQWPSNCSLYVDSSTHNGSMRSPSSRLSMRFVLYEWVLCVWQPSASSTVYLSLPFPPINDCLSGRFTVCIWHFQFAWHRSIYFRTIGMLHWDGHVHSSWMMYPFGSHWKIRERMSSCCLITVQGVGWKSCLIKLIKENVLKISLHPAFRT